MQKKLGGSQGNHIFSFFKIDAPIHEAMKKNILYLEKKAQKKIAKLAATKGAEDSKPTLPVVQEKPGITKHLERTKKGRHPSSK